ncbi:tryptophan synthase subunit alpha [Methanomicrobium antiquum]|uniref:Tryptophan synthase alpha chain n=1 Tax=Methanomicrobium antiquum TaxID=487686 RepID=A0AAF0JNI7_9EURY|nr:tryptophan synthase subunit alpha [Methanomicrobium antiquum]WFN37451.1 tryptophan synthase subunit alpha [Methanomicrobium antiquum]
MDGVLAKGILGRERLSRAFEKPGFVAYTVAGDPTISDSVQIAKALIDGGCDVLELGVPFSDPVADGGVIQAGDKRAIDAGISVDGVFEIVKDIRKYSDVAVVFLVYANIVYQRGIDRFYNEAKEAGVDGILIVDMPPEEAGEVYSASLKTGIAQIFLVTQTTSDERLYGILEMAFGFIYLVSALGVTGKRSEVSGEAYYLLQRVRRALDLAGKDVPVAVGFGISEPLHAEEIIRAGADGVIVGSAIVSIIEKNREDISRACSELRNYVGMMKQAVSLK